MHAREQLIQRYFRIMSKFLSGPESVIQRYLNLPEVAKHWHWMKDYNPNTNNSRYNSYSSYSDDPYHANFPTDIEVVGAGFTPINGDYTLTNK